MVHNDTEASLVLEVWSLLKQNIPANKKIEIAETLLKIFEEHGIQPDELDGLHGNDTVIDLVLEETYGVENSADEDSEEDYD